MRGVIVALVCLLASPVFAATYHVKSVSTCSNHGTVLGAACIDTSGCGSVSTPCCTLQSAMNISVLTSGDVIQAHNETKVYTTADATNYAVYIDVAGITIEEAAGDSYVINMANNSSIPIGVRVAASDVTVKGIKVTGKWDSSVDTSRTGVFEVGRSGLVISNITLDGIEGDNEEQDYTPTPPITTNTSSYVGILISDGAHGVTVKNVVNFSGGFNTMVSIVNCGSDPVGGYLFRDNVWTNTRNLVLADSVATGIRIANCGADTTSGQFVSFNEFYNNTGAEKHRHLYIRENGIGIRILNGRFIASSAISSAGAIYLQEDLAGPGGWPEEDVIIANNYFKGGSGTGVRWPQCFDAEVRNNIFDGYSVGTNEDYSCKTGNTSSVRSGTFTYNAISGATLATCDGTSCVSTTGSIANATINATSVGRLQASSASCINGGTPDPVACPLSIRNESVACSNDIDGTLRGTTWDIGADEYSGTQTCGNNAREGTEICDGTDVGTDSCVNRGFSGGTLTCNSCTSITTEMCTLASTSRSVLQGTTIKGGSLP